MRTEEIYVSFKVKSDLKAVAAIMGVETEDEAAEVLLTSAMERFPQLDKLRAKLKAARQNALEEWKKEHIPQ